MQFAIFLSQFFFWGSLAFASDSPQQGKPNEIVKLNIGGHKFETTLQTINNSGSEALKALFKGNFAPSKDADGYHFFDCFDQYGSIMHQWICHKKIATDCNVEIASDAAEYFACDGLKETLAQIKTEYSWKWRQLELIPGGQQIDGQMVSLCPICNHLIKYSAPRLNNGIATVLAHILVSHEGKIAIDPRSTNTWSCIATVQYKHEDCRPSNESDFGAALVYLRGNYRGQINFRCPLDNCNFNLWESSNNNNQHLEPIKKHLTDFHHASIQHINDNVVIFTYPLKIGN
jgi:hypothetical protein